MSECFALLTAHIDNLEAQHRAGINPAPREIELLFALNRDAKLDHEDPTALTIEVDPAAVDEALKADIAEMIGWKASPPAAPQERVVEAGDQAVETVIPMKPARRQRKPARAQKKMRRPARGRKQVA